MSSAVTQVDLFGVIDAAQTEREAWAARFERATWTAPHDPTITGLGWRCPRCREVEPNDFLLTINHGFNPLMPGHEPRFADRPHLCAKQHARHSQRRYRRMTTIAKARGATA